MKSCNTFPCNGKIDRTCRERLNCHSAKVFWLTGLPSSGKSTLAHLAEETLHLHGIHTYVFDGDNVRHGLCGDLGFSPVDRSENIRRIAEVVRLFLDAGVVCLCAFVSPLEANRQKVREVVGSKDYSEIFIKCPVTVCETRDVKGLYAKARKGLIEDYTGISAPYEEPKAPDLTIDTTQSALSESVRTLTSFILNTIAYQKTR
ncbi:MAG: adenylyl-sulfate kinase [Desulfovibrio sp.]|jgi:adenylylsulfate kinase|nr:adenylyl-sulfate kinase [Desulfovibrio sp.]